MKSEYRRFFLNLRREIDKDYVDKASREIFDRLKEENFYKNSKSVFVYLSKNKEVRTDLIIKDLLAQNKEVYVPKIEGNFMKAARLYSLSDLVDGKFSIKTTTSETYTKNPDLSLVPGLSFDRDKNRLGYGGGYYDRFLKESDTKSVGLFVSLFESSKLPTNKNDQKLDYIITDKEII